MLSFADFSALTEDAKWALIDGDAIPARPAEQKLVTCKPNWIAPLYTDTPMPHYIPCQGTSITLDAANVYNGSLVDENARDVVEMSWRGYTCQLYDGTLKMCPLNATTSTLAGTCNGVAFQFVGTKLAYGCWPGFIEMYKSK